MFFFTPHERRAVIFISAAFFLGICCDIFFKIYPPGLGALHVLDEPGPSHKVNINTASYTELLSVPGIGPSIAARIIYAREKRKFVSLQELDSIKGFSKKMRRHALEHLTPGVP